MRFLMLRRKALVTLRHEGAGRPGKAALEIRRDEGVPASMVLRNNLPPMLPGRATHFFHYEHRCHGRVGVDAWFSERDMPDMDGNHLVCPVCGQVGLRVVTVPQQSGALRIGTTPWPP